MNVCRAGIRSRGQTYVSVVVSLAIMSAGAGVVTPAVVRRSQSAKDHSLANLSQLTLATVMYAEDNGGFLPGWVHNPPTSAYPYAHNTWDEQIYPYVKSDDAYNDRFVNGGKGIQSVSQPRPWTRVLTYGMNQLLITPPRKTFDGRANQTMPTPANPPHSLRLDRLPDPQNTILFAELATAEPHRVTTALFMNTVPTPYTHTTGSGEASDQYTKALSSWIDISPREWVENKGIGGISNYDPAGWAPGYGIARSFYKSDDPGNLGGGCYAFCDGHVEFLHLIDTVGFGQPDARGKGISTSAQMWSSMNPYNRWNPYPPTTTTRR